MTKRTFVRIVSFLVGMVLGAVNTLWNFRNSETCNPPIKNPTQTERTAQ